MAMMLRLRRSQEGGHRCRLRMATNLDKALTAMPTVPGFVNQRLLHGLVAIHGTQARSMVGEGTTIAQVEARGGDNIGSGMRD